MRALIPFLFLLAGCGSTANRQTHLVETQRTTTAPIVVDTPFGTFTAQPTQATTQRSQREVETATTTLDLPDVGGAVMLAAQGTPWGGLIAGGLGVITAAFTAKKAVDNARQRDELADGIESAKDHLDPETWSRVKKSLIDNQSDDTAAAVKRRVG